MNTVEERTDTFKKYLNTLSPQKLSNMRALINSAGFQRLMTMVSIFKPASAGTGNDNADGNFCVARLGEIRGWESYEGLLNTIVDFRPADKTQEELEENYQPPQIETN